jgi:hypothetical protein
MPTRQDIEAAVVLVEEISQKAEQAATLLGTFGGDYYSDAAVPGILEIQKESARVLVKLMASQAGVAPEKRTGPGYTPGTNKTVVGVSTAAATSIPRLRGHGVRHLPNGLRKR